MHHSQNSSNSDDHPLTPVHTLELSEAPFFSIKTSWLRYFLAFNHVAESQTVCGATACFLCLFPVPQAATPSHGVLRTYEPTLGSSSASPAC